MNTDPSTMALEAAAFRRLTQHLQSRTDVQNIDMMILAGFCRNCLSTWYKEAADDAGIALDNDAARRVIYGMDYGAWKEKHQSPATAEQLEKLKASHAH